MYMVSSFLFLFVYFSWSFQKFSFQLQPIVLELKIESLFWKLVADYNDFQKILLLFPNVEHGLNDNSKIVHLTPTYVEVTTFGNLGTFGLTFVEFHNLIVSCYCCASTFSHLRSSASTASSNKPFWKRKTMEFVWSVSAHLTRYYYEKQF